MSRAALPEHVQELLVTMARLHRDNRYGRVTRTVEQITGQPARSVEAFVAAHAQLFGVSATGA
jgi:anthranilate/para-aminobenzoate synthase component I